MRHTNYSIVIILSLLVSVGISGVEKEIPVSEVPEAVLKAAQEALPGVRFTEAEMEESKGVITYELEGMKGDYEYEIELASDGKVIEIEQELDDDDHEEAHHGDHDEDHSGDHDGDHSDDHDDDHDAGHQEHED